MDNNSSLSSLEDKLVRLDCSIQALKAIEDLLSFCPPEHQVNAHALGHLLFVVRKELKDVQRELDKVI